MPLTISGKLSIVASAELGPLGDLNGAPVEYDWLMPGFAPFLLPWVAILGMLSLKTNRTRGVWWIWLPLGLLTIITMLPMPDLPVGPEFLLDPVAGLAMGVAAAWLLADRFGGAHRMLTWFGLAATLAAAAALTFALRAGDGLFEADSVPILMILGLAAVVVSTALVLTGRLCRGTYSAWRVFVFTTLLIPLGWLLIGLPFFLFATLASGGELDWGEFLIPVGIIGGITVAAVLPFLVLAVIHPFFRGRLKTILHLRDEPPPIVLALDPARLSQAG